jgi:hypothetical protein
MRLLLVEDDKKGARVVAPGLVEEDFVVGLALTDLLDDAVKFSPEGGGR